jgi:peptide deformylase
MALLKIHTFPDPVLREKARPVAAFDAELRRLARDMAETMYAAPGVGLAANQVGVLKQLIVIDTREENGPTTGLLALVNPRVVASEGEVLFEEGCLSLPDERAEVERFEWVKVEAQDLEGAPVTIAGSGLLAIVLQHEIDHLNGILFMDHLSPIRRAAVKKRLRKLKEEAAKAG